MLTQENIIIILFSLPIYQLLFYTIQLITLKKKEASRKYLGLLLLAMTLFLIINALYNLGQDNLIKSFYIFYVPLLLILPPVFYLYLVSLTHEENHVKPFSKFILFIPPLLALVLNLLTFGLASSYQKQLYLLTDLSILNTSFSGANSAMLVMWFSLSILLAAQIIFAFIKTSALLKMEKAISDEQPSRLAHLQFRWIFIIAFSLLLFVVAAAIYILFIGPKGLSYSVVFNVVMLLSGGLIGYYGMKQDNLFTEVRAVGTTRPAFVDKVEQNLPEDNQKLIPDDEANEILEKIKTLMEQEKPYLNKRFSIDDLAKITGLKKARITYVINEIMGKNFYGLLNDYRVMEAIRILEGDDVNSTMDAIADMSGFHSRSSFYACFKKYTGQTPREFILDLKQNEGKKPQP